MELDEKNKKIEEVLYIISNEVNKEYGGLIDKYRIKELYDKFKNSEKDLQDDIIPEIKDIIEKIISEYVDLKRNLEQMMEMKMKNEKDKLSSLSNSKAIELNEQKINYLVIEQLDSKEDVKKYISNVCSQFPSIDSQTMLDKYDSIISDEQIEEVRSTLSQKYKSELNSKYEDIKIESPEDARAKLIQAGVDSNNIDNFVEKVANGERLEALIQLEKEYGEQAINSLNNSQSETTEEVEVEDAILDNTNGQIYLKNKTNVKRLVKYPNGFGFTAMLIALVSFGIGVMSAITYFVISSLFK